MLKKEKIKEIALWDELLYFLKYKGSIKNHVSYHDFIKTTCEPSSLGASLQWVDKVENGFIDARENCIAKFDIK